MATNYIFVTGGVVSSLGKGIAAASLGSNFRSTWLKRDYYEIRPLHQRGPGYNEPNPTRRSIRDTRRGGNRFRLRSLRAFYSH